MAARSIPSILYVRHRLNLEKQKSFSRIVPILAHLAAITVVLGLAISGLSPLLVAGMFGVLLVRCVIGLSAYRRKVKAMKIGIGEVIYGTLTVAALIIGYYSGF